MDQINLNAWIDRSDITHGGISAQHAQMVHSVLGKPGTAAPSEGDRLPELWHWYGFPPTVGMDALGPDGHPKLGDFMPPVRLNRRMWAGGTVEFIAPLYVGETLKRRTTIANIVEKSGAAGDIVIMSLDHEIHGACGLAVMERQDIVYLQIPDSYTPLKKQAPPPNPDINERVSVSTPLLFRYSAITFNAHRIHYDLPYAQDVEQYPDLVVQGPLQTQLLMDLATAHRRCAPKLFSYRGVHPLFAGDSVEAVAVKTDPSEWHLSTVAGGTHNTMQANAIWEI
jgi:3-methylfumaryl-CoA hydratase